MPFDISGAIAFDRVVLLMSRLVVSDVAAWVIKPLWLLDGAGVLFHRAAHAELATGA